MCTISILYRRAEPPSALLPGGTAAVRAFCFKPCATMPWTAALRLWTAIFLRKEGCTAPRGRGLPPTARLVRNLSTKTRPDGGALTLILERWISSVQSSVVAQNGVSPQSEGFRELVDREIYRVVGALSELVHGFDFARLLSLYYKAYLDGDDQLKANVIKWFRGEYSSKSEARAELGINIIITDDDWYDYIKLFSLFLHEAGYSGLLVLIDELVNIYKVPNAITRQYNYGKAAYYVQRCASGKGKLYGHHHVRHAPVH